MPEGKVSFKLGESRFNVVIVNVDPATVRELIELINVTPGCFAIEDEWIPGFKPVVAYVDDADGYARLRETLAIASKRGLLK